MIVCPRCGLRVANLHPLPPEILTKEVIAAVSGDDENPEPEACRECITDLMAG